MSGPVSIRRVPGLAGGRPIVPGRRLMVYDLVSQSCYAADEARLREYLADFELTLAGLSAALSYCVGLQCLAPPGGPLCVGCCLQAQQEGPDYPAGQLEEFVLDGLLYTRALDGSMTFPGSIADYLRDEQGRAGWLMAADVQSRYACLLPAG